MTELSLGGSAFLSLLLVAAIGAQTQFMPDQARSGDSYLPAVVGQRAGLAIGDVDGDSDADVVMSHGLGTLFLRELAGWAVVTLPGGAGQRQPRFVDLDGDNDLDLIFGPRDGTTSSDIQMLRNDGGAVFSTVTLPAPLPGGLLQGIVAGDVDGDGDADLVLTPVPVAVPIQRIQLYRNVGNLTFQFEPAAMPSGMPFGCWPDLVDVDGDADLDVVASSVGGGYVLLTNDGLGTFTDARPLLPQMRIGHVHTVAADLDGDTFQDTASVWFNGDIDVLWGSSTGFQFEAAVASGVTDRVHAADYDGDGDLDLVAFHGGGFDLVRNLGSRQFAREVVTAQGTLLGEGCGDVNGDGAGDVLATFGDGPQVQAYLGSSTGFLVDAVSELGFHSVPGEGDYFQCPTAGDVDGDGRQDVLLPTTNGLVVQRGLGAGAYQGHRSPHPQVVATAVQRQRLADLDGDGDPDLVVSTTGPLEAFENDGTGMFSPWFTLAGSSSLGDHVQFGDVDGDQDLDIVRVDFNNVLLYTNAGSGAFGLPTVLASGANIRRTLLLADLNADGLLDIVTDIPAGSGQLLLKGDGAGGFQSDPFFMANLGGLPIGMAAGDANGDGDVDLVVRCQFGQLVRLHTGDGAGGFIESPTQMPAIQGSGGQALLFRDFDRDGDPDVFTLVGGGSNGARLLINDGAGTFLNLTGSRWSMPTVLSSNDNNDALAVDYDGDGDPDIGIGGPNNFEQILAWNHARQLVSRAAPQIGGAFRLDAFSGPGFSPAGLMFTFASFGQGSSPLLLPGIEGGYDLDTGTIATVNVAVTGSVGIGQTTLLIPTAVQLTGTTIYFQNLFASSLALPGFTNTVVETIVP